MQKPVTHRQVLTIAGPIVLSNATVPLLGIIDTGVIGQMGLAAPVGAVGIGAVILTAIYWLFGFLRMGTTGLVAQAHGAGDTAESSAIFSRAMMIGLAAGLGIMLLQIMLFRAAFALSPASAEVETLTRQYLEVRIWGAPATIMLYAITGWLVAVGRTGRVFVLQLWMNGLNIGLDLWFVLHLGWGVEGVALATLIAEWSGLALGLLLCRPVFAGPGWRDWARVFDRRKLKRMLLVNADIMIRSVALQGAFMSFMFFGAALGDVRLAANQVLLQFLELTAFALDGFAFAAEALVGATIGAVQGTLSREEKRNRVSQAARICSQWGVGGALLLGAFFWLAGGLLIDLMVTSPDVREAARNYLFWAALSPVFGIAAWMFDGIFIGATWTGSMRNAMLLSVLIYCAALAVLLPLFGNHGLWAALMVLNIARGLTMWRSYNKEMRRI